MYEITGTICLHYLWTCKSVRFFRKAVSQYISNFKIHILCDSDFTYPTNISQVFLDVGTSTFTAVFHVMPKTVFQQKTSYINYRTFILWNTSSHCKELHPPIRKDDQDILKEPRCTTFCRLLPHFPLL